MTDFSCESTIKAVRKPRPCDACGVKINVGETATRWAGVSQGDFHSIIYHPECRAAEIALNRLHDTFWHDEWMSLSEMEWDDAPWLLEEYPIVAARRGITAETIREDLEEREACRLAFLKPSVRNEGKPECS